MRYDWAFAERVRCSRREQLECAAAIPDTVALAAKARREGLLSLEGDLERLQSGFLRVALQLVIDGTDPACLREIMELRLVTGEYRGSELLKRVISLEGALSIQAGDNPQMVLQKLASFFGEGGLDLVGPVTAAPADAPPPEAVEAASGQVPTRTEPAPRPTPEMVQAVQRLAELHGRRLEAVRRLEQEQLELARLEVRKLLGEAGISLPAGDDSPDVEVQAIRLLAGRSPELLASLPGMLTGPDGEAVLARVIPFEGLVELDDRSIQKALREIDSGTLAVSLRGASAQVTARIYANMSKRAAALLKEDIEYAPPLRESEVLAARQRLMTCLWRLAEHGEILLPWREPAP